MALPNNRGGLFINDLPKSDVILDSSQCFEYKITSDELIKRFMQNLNHVSRNSIIESPGAEIGKISSFDDIQPDHSYEFKYHNLFHPNYYLNHDGSINSVIGYTAMSALNTIYAVDEVDVMMGYFTKSKLPNGDMIITADAQAPYGPIQCIFKIENNVESKTCICNLHIRAAYINLNYFISGVITSALEHVDTFMMKPYMKRFRDMGTMSATEYNKFVDSKND
jgi:hypothetical protein